jgi:hypothetical protein
MRVGTYVDNELGIVMYVTFADSDRSLRAARNIANSNQTNEFHRRAAPTRARHR